MIGTVKFFNRERGHGYITPDDGGGDVRFASDAVHGLSAEPTPGDRVQFETIHDGGRRFAATVGPMVTLSSGNGHTGNCFVVMPSGRTTEEVRWFSGWYKMVIEDGVRAAGYEPFLAAAQDQPSAINDEIRAHLAFDPMVVVDLGGFSSDAEPNPNVMYELGLRHALNLPVVLMAWANQRLPFDISNQRVIMERRDLLDIPTNRDRLTRFIQEAAAGNYYRPMDAVGRIATLERAETALNPSSVLGALVREVRDLKSRVSPRQRYSESTRIKQALGTKAKRKALLARFLSAGGTEHQWREVLQMTVGKVGFANAADKLPELLRLAQGVPAEKVHSSASTTARHPVRLSEELLEQVRMLMPAQPWPTGSASLVAEKLGVTRSQVRKATQELIRRGIFQEQQEGVLLSKAVPSVGSEMLSSPLEDDVSDPTPQA